MADQAQPEENPVFVPKAELTAVSNNAPKIIRRNVANAVAKSAAVPKTAAAPKAAVKGFVPKAAVKGFVPPKAAVKGFVPPIAKDTTAKVVVKPCPLVKPLPPNIVISETVKLPVPESILEALPQKMTGELIAPKPAIVRAPISDSNSNSNSNIENDIISDTESESMSDTDSDSESESESNSNSNNNNDNGIDDMLDTYTDKEYDIRHEDVYQMNTEIYTPHSSRSFKKFINDEFQEFELQPNPNRLDENACQKLGKAAETGVESFLYQKFVREYMRNNSPYRGILVYHGLGSGKTCSAIAAAEALYGSSGKKIIVMTPFSLQNNFIREITFCGFKHFHTDNHWNKITLDEEGDTISTFAYNTLDLSDEYLTKVRKREDADRQVIWIPDFDKPSNFKERTASERDDITQQIIESIKNRITFISYNGVTAKTLKEYACTVDANGDRFFDNKIIVIDEIHNLTRLMHGKIIPYIVQRAKKARKIPVEPIVPGKWRPGLCGKQDNYSRAYLFYKLLTDARNSKIIGLSGTPIINFPDELGILSNILSGYIECVECTIGSIDKKELDKLYTFINKEPRVDVIRFRPLAEMYQVLISVFPEGYEKVYDDAKQVNVQGVHYNKDAQESIRDVYARLRPHITKLSKIRSEEFKSYPRLPIDEEEFKNTFVDPGTLTVKDPLVLKKRLTGLISYYQGSKEEYMPRVIRDKLIKCKMSNYMLSLYAVERKREIDGERQKDKKEAGDIFSAVEVFAEMANPSSYRFRSRAYCNFTFPSVMKRPFPNNGVVMDMIDTVPEDAADSEKLKKIKEEIAKVDTNVIEADVLRTEEDKALAEGVVTEGVVTEGVATEGVAVTEGVAAATGDISVEDEGIALDATDAPKGSKAPKAPKALSKGVITNADYQDDISEEEHAQIAAIEGKEVNKKPIGVVASSKNREIANKSAKKSAKANRVLTSKEIAEQKEQMGGAPNDPVIKRAPIADSSDDEAEVVIPSVIQRAPIVDSSDDEAEVPVIQRAPIVDSSDNEAEVPVVAKPLTAVSKPLTAVAKPLTARKKYTTSIAPTVPTKGLSQAVVQELKDYEEQLRQLMQELDYRRDDFLQLGEDSEAEMDEKEDRETATVTGVQEDPDKKKDGEEPAENELKTYSCKLHKMLHKINKSKGSNLVYSQFKTVEGLGVLGIALKANDFEEIIIEGSDENPHFSDETLESFERDKEERAEKPKKKLFTKRFILFTGEGSSKRRQLILNIFNGNLNALPENIRTPLLPFEKDGNNYGEICWVIGITGAGAEGISLKCCRTVHIMEPYWNNVRLEQVKGRAIRICSHKDLPYKERTVKIYTYCTVFSTKQKDKLDNTIKISDGDKTSDRNVYDVSSVKDKINSGFLQIMKESAIDCMLNRVDNKGIQCLDIIGIDRPGKIPSYMFDPNLEYDRILTSIEFKQTDVKVEKGTKAKAIKASEAALGKIKLATITYKGKDYKACLQSGTGGLIYHVYDIPNLTAKQQDLIAQDSQRPAGTPPQVPIAGTIECLPLYARTTTPFKSATITLKP